MPRSQEMRTKNQVSKWSIIFFFLKIAEYLGFSSSGGAN
jgi:hypothetical protein